MTILVGALALACGASLTQRASAVVPAGSAEEFPAVIAGSLTGYPVTIVAGPEGMLWYTDANGKIGRMTPDGYITGEFSVPLDPIPSVHEGRQPYALAVGSDGNLWFTDRGFDDEGYSFIGRVTPTGDVKEFRLPRSDVEPEGIALGPDGGMWFTERGNDGTGAIGHVTPGGAVSEYVIPAGQQLGLSGFNMPETSKPKDISLGPDGRMWFTDQGHNAEAKSFIGMIDTGTDAISEFQLPTQNSVPVSIVMGSDRAMWFTESGVTQVGRIAPDGTLSEFRVPSTNNYLDDIALGPDGNLWFTEGVRTNTIARITTTGTVTSFSPITNGEGSPVAIALGPDGNMWFTDSEADKVGRLITPLTPENVQPPTLSGRAEQGQVLSVSDGSWSDTPSGFAYQWQSCNAASATCVPLHGELTARHLLTTDDVGRTLRAMVTAGNVGGSTSVMSAPSPMVQAAMPVPMLTEPLSGSVSPLVVDSTLTWRFGWARRYTIVESLIAHAVPAGGLVEVSCAGRGCAFAHKHSAIVARRDACRGHRCRTGTRATPAGEVALTAFFKRRYLGVGSRIVVRVVKAGWNGKSFAFTVRANRAPRVEIACLTTDSRELRGEC